MDDLRRQIDAIDDQLHDLLMQRTDLVKEVSRAKQRENTDIVRPGREAAILRRLLGRHRGPFPRLALARIWRELMTGQVTVQGPFAVAVYTPPEWPGIWDLARDHYGAHPPMTAYRSIGQVIRAVTDRSATVGILPVPREGDADPWWRHLLSRDKTAPRIIARLPFAGRGNARAVDGDVLAIAASLPEETGADHSFIVIETKSGISRTKLMASLQQIDLGVAMLAGWSDAGVTLTLAEIDSYVAADDPRLTQLAADLGEPADRILVIGGYAIPLTETEQTADALTVP
ncbi:MAG TPA: chorismate mutase [Stellaceae bacterium]|nr:chorismate mutase [Stellaceae bacterium]